MSANLLIRLAGWFIVSCAAAQTSAPFDYAAFLKGVRAPADFTVELAAGEPAVRFPMFATFDDRGRIFVAESAGGDLYEELKTQTRRCRISVLEDRDGDGVFETAQVFAEKLVCPTRHASGGSRRAWWRWQKTSASREIRLSRITRNI